jgi:hypothetical protein
MYLEIELKTTIFFCVFLKHRIVFENGVNIKSQSFLIMIFISLADFDFLRNKMNAK